MIPRRVVRELERQLTREPGNLTVRVTLAAAYRELGRAADSVEQYRLVATGYLQEGRNDEAMAACTSALALAPDDRELQALQARARAAQLAAPRRADPATAQGRRPLRPSERAPERSASASGSDLETPLPAPMPLHDSADSLADLPVGLTTHDETAERPTPPTAAPERPVPPVLPPPPPPQGTLLGFGPTPAPRALGFGGPLPRLSAPPAPQPRPGALPPRAETRPGERITRRIEPELGSDPSIELVDDPSLELVDDPAVDGFENFSVDELGLDELDVAMPVVPLTEVRRAGDRPSSPDISSDLATRKRPRMSAHELGLLDLEVLHAPAEAAAAPMAALDGGADDVLVDVKLVSEQGAYVAREGGAFASGSGERAIDLARTAQMPAAAAAGDAPGELPDTALDHEALPAIEVDADPGASFAVVRSLPIAPSDFDDEPTQPPAAGAPAPEDGDGDGDGDEARELPAVGRDFHPESSIGDGESGTFAGGFGGTLAELAPDGMALDGPLGVFSMLPPDAAGELARRAVVKLYDDGEIVVREGEIGDSCFVIARGEVVVTRNAAHGEAPIELARLGEGALFGEFALLADRRRHATVTALGEVEAYLIPRHLLRELAMLYPDVQPALDRFYRERLLANLIQTSPLFANLALDQRAGLLAAFEPMRVESGVAIVRQGERAGGLFLIVLGAVDVVCVTEDRRAVVLATLAEGAYVGEISLLSGEVATASVVAAGPVELAALPARVFYRVVSEYPELWAAMRDEAAARRLRNERLLAGRTGVV